MGPGSTISADNEARDYNCHAGAIGLHAFSNLSHSRTTPPTFVYLLKECYLNGTLSASQKFKTLHYRVSQAFCNAPQPGPATFVVQCLYIVPLVGFPCAKVFINLFMSSLRHLKTMETGEDDFSTAKCLAAQLFVDILSSTVHEKHVLVKLLETFALELKDIKEATNGTLDTTKTYIEHHISELMDSESYAIAAALMEHFSIRMYSEPFLLKLVQSNQFIPADKWATFMGKPMICLLVRKYLELKMLKNANDMIQKNNLNPEFPHVRQLYKESVVKKFAEKGCWDVAEERASNRQLKGYLVHLALEHGYTEKVEELCQRYSLDLANFTAVPDESSSDRFLDLKKLVLDDIIWVDEINGLKAATSYIEGCKVVGLDCEWKPNFMKGSKPNKVSIIQIASQNRAFIFDLIKLYKHEPKELNSCFKRIFFSPQILKLGYSWECDLHELSHSYGDLDCFKYYEMLLDIQNLCIEHNGGLSGLTEKILGAGLNKTRRNSNWEQRPLTRNQIEYAALDAAVLVRIFNNVCSDEDDTWKSHIVSTEIEYVNRAMEIKKNP